MPEISLRQNPLPRRPRVSGQRPLRRWSLRATGSVPDWGVVSLTLAHGGSPTLQRVLRCILLSQNLSQHRDGKQC